MPSLPAIISGCRISFEDVRFLPLPRSAGSRSPPRGSVAIEQVAGEVDDATASARYAGRVRQRHAFEYCRYSSCGQAREPDRLDGEARVGERRFELLPHRGVLQPLDRRVDAALEQSPAAA